MLRHEGFPVANNSHKIAVAASITIASIIGEGIQRELIPFTYHVEPTMYGNDVMDLTIFGLRSM
jgi:hypothetical protein